MTRPIIVALHGVGSSAPDMAAALAAAGHRVDPIVTAGFGHAIGTDSITAIAHWLAASDRANTSNKGVIT